MSVYNSETRLIDSRNMSVFLATQYRDTLGMLVLGIVVCL